MKERPIPFSAPMVRAILAGAKTQTRRIVKLDRAVGEPHVPDGHALDLIYPGSLQHYAYTTPDWDRPSWRVQKLCDESCRHIDDVGPYDGRHTVAWGPMPYAPGDQLWVREAFTHITGNGIRVHYRADGEPLDREGRVLPTEPGLRRWSPSIHMPRKLSRITLEVIGVRVERLHAITEADARAEGVERDTEPCDHTRLSCEEIGCMGPTYRSTFAELWHEINGADSWDANPWVWVVEFRRVEAEAKERAA